MFTLEGLAYTHHRTIVRATNTMENEVVAALIGGIAGVVAGIGAAWVTMRAQITKVQIQLGAQHRGELVRRQLDACEDIWAIFDAASRSGGAGRMLQGQEGKRFIKVENAQAFIRRLEEAFNSKSGIYLSRNCRSKLFKFRDFLREQLSSAQTDQEEMSLPLPEEQFKRFYELRRQARLALRAEVGTEDLRVAREALRQSEA